MKKKDTEEITLPPIQHVESKSDIVKKDLPLNPIHSFQSLFREKYKWNKMEGAKSEVREMMKNKRKFSFGSWKKREIFHLCTSWFLTTSKLTTAPAIGGSPSMLWGPNKAQVQLLIYVINSIYKIIAYYCRYIIHK